MENSNNNPLLCDFETGICETAVETNVSNRDVKADQGKVKIIYFTDPICSSCWGIEPQLRKLELEYGTSFEIEYHMGGLLPDWSYRSGGISGPADVASHWDEASHHYQMPIDGDVWLEDPLSSSYPPSIAFKAAQLQDQTKALKFLRRIKEMVFLEKKNIAKWEHLHQAAVQVGLNADLMWQDFEGQAQELFREDLELAKSLGVRGFPTLFFVNEQEERRTVYGSRSYEMLEGTLLQLAPTATRINYHRTWENVFQTFPTLTTREFAELTGRTGGDASVVLEQLVSGQKLTKLVTKNGTLWQLANEEPHSSDHTA